ncbi:hypothetical protein G6F56_001941 [Rhizopus delemar]|nr:hypothetical protein G6F56_001941 [Rhizopus delemar]
MDLEPLLRKFLQEMKPKLKPLRRKSKLTCIQPIHHRPVDTVSNSLLYKSTNTTQRFEKYSDHSHNFVQDKMSFL